MILRVYVSFFGFPFLVGSPLSYRFRFHGVTFLPHFFLPRPGQYYAESAAGVLDSIGKKFSGTK